MMHPYVGSVSPISIERLVNFLSNPNVLWTIATRGASSYIHYPLLELNFGRDIWVTFNLEEPRYPVLSVTISKSITEQNDVSFPLAAALLYILKPSLSTSYGKTVTVRRLEDFVRTLFGTAEPNTYLVKFVKVLCEKYPETTIPTLVKLFHALLEAGYGKVKMEEGKFTIDLPNPRSLAYYLKFIPKEIANEIESLFEKAGEVYVVAPYFPHVGLVYAPSKWERTLRYVYVGIGAPQIFDIDIGSPIIEATPDIFLQNLEHGRVLVRKIF